MEKFTVEQYQEAKVVAKELGINVVGKSKQTLVDLVNEKIDEKNEGQQNEEVVEIPEYVNIVGTTMNKNGVAKHILAGRTAKVVGPSKTAGKLRVILLDKQGNEQKCIITVETVNTVLVKNNKEVAV